MSDKEFMEEYGIIAISGYKYRKLKAERDRYKKALEKAIIDLSECEGRDFIQADLEQALKESDE